MTSTRYDLRPSRAPHRLLLPSAPSPLNPLCLALQSSFTGQPLQAGKELGVASLGVQERLGVCELESHEGRRGEQGEQEEGASASV